MPGDASPSITLVTLGQPMSSARGAVTPHRYRADNTSHMGSRTVYNQRQPRGATQCRATFPDAGSMGSGA